jgi:hypothetical protein
MAKKVEPLLFSTTAPTNLEVPASNLAEGPESAKVEDLKIVSGNGASEGQPELVSSITKGAPTPLPESATTGEAPDEWALENTCIKGGVNTPIEMRKVWTEFGCHRPSSHDYIRVYPTEPARSYYFIEPKIEGVQHSLYLVLPNILPSLLAVLGTRFLLVKSLYLTVTSLKVPFLWPIGERTMDGKDYAAWSSTRNTALEAKDKWIQVSWNGTGYDVGTPKEELGEPVWPDLPYKDMVRLALTGKRIDTVDHPIVRRLRGFKD